jgi:hypothetical protein
MHMRPAFPLIALCCPLLLGAQQKVSYGHAATSSVSVRLMAAVASVQVIGWEKDSVDVSGVIATGSRFQMFGGTPSGATKGIKGYVELPNDHAVIEGKVVMRVPRDARVWLKTGSADIDVSGVTGGVDVNVVGGSITVHGNVRELRAESMDGNVVIDGVAEWARLKTATGDITLKGGTDIGASTISGTIRASGADIERAKLEATTGAVFFASGLVRNASIELETHSGNVDIALPWKSDFEIEAATITGTIENRMTKLPPSPGREGRGMTLTTQGGSGGSRIVVRSFKGGIALRGR